MKREEKILRIHKHLLEKQGEYAGIAEKYWEVNYLQHSFDKPSEYTITMEQSLEFDKYAIKYIAKNLYMSQKQARIEFLWWDFQFGLIIKN